MVANTKIKAASVIAALAIFCFFVGCASNPGSPSNTQVSTENAESLSLDVLNLVKALLDTTEFPKRQFALRQNDPLLKKFGLLRKPKSFEAIDIESGETYLVSSTEEGSADSWKLDNVKLVAKQIFGEGRDTYSLLSKQLMNVENQSGTKYQLYINKAMTYRTDSEFKTPDQGAFVIAANSSNLYVVINDGELNIKLDETGTGKF